ncbi:hypothetical protein [uncultured Psychroserpens sp.]|uniref:hypothetical protein n=1 Tax=uncultured Psychroserpens sp. TaxID=255436 RepID=UPI00262A3D03|nr:hypothetical protein [uncultured Psychroserpens sp.]
MKKQLLFLTITSLLLFFNSHSQSTFYSLENNKVKSIKKNESTSIIQFVDNEDDNNKDAFTTFLFNNLLFPLVRDNISKLFYNPKKFIYEQAGFHSFIEYDHGSPRLKSDFNNQDLIYFQQYIFDFKDNNNAPINPIKAIELSFKIEKTAANNAQSDQTINLLSLAKAELNYSGAKIKNNKKEINLIVEVLFNYYDSYGELRAFKTEPYNISKISANGSQNTITDKKQILPNMKIVTSVQIKVTEVNSRKKDLDKWLELYTENKDKIQSFIFDNIKL